jgi:hypothetical protein
MAEQKGIFWFIENQPGNSSLKDRRWHGKRSGVFKTVSVVS